MITIYLNVPPYWERVLQYRERVLHLNAPPYGEWILPVASIAKHGGHVRVG
jgi:hypothetical protein